MIYLDIIYIPAINLNIFDVSFSCSLVHEVRLKKDINACMSHLTVSQMPSEETTFLCSLYS